MNDGFGEMVLFCGKRRDDGVIEYEDEWALVLGAALMLNELSNMYEWIKIVDGNLAEWVRSI